MNTSISSTLLFLLVSINLISCDTRAEFIADPKIVSAEAYCLALGAVHIDDSIEYRSLIMCSMMPILPKDVITPENMIAKINDSTGLAALKHVFYQQGKPLEVNPSRSTGFPSFFVLFRRDKGQNDTFAFQEDMGALFYKNFDSLYQYPRSSMQTVFNLFGCDSVGCN